MTVAEFLSRLETHPDLPLVFDTGDGRIAPGYHVTEIKSLQVRAMDCGGDASAWNETIVQLWSPDRPEGAHLPIEKFLAIYRRVAEATEIDASSYLRVEYGPAGDPAVAYLATDVVREDAAVVVRLTAPAVACKGRDRSVGDLPSVATLEPVAAVATVGEGTTTCCRADASAACCA